MLRAAEFEGLLLWDEGPKRAALADILRIHDWAYLRKLQVGGWVGAWGGVWGRVGHEHQR